MSAHTPELAAGTIIDGRARLVRLLGRGGMGDVWAAQHLALNSEVAVKILSQQFASEPDAVARFSREAQAIARIKSPYVVQIYDYGVHAGTPYLMMELLEGETLIARIRREKRFSLEDTQTIVTQVCKALGQAHALGIIHRDLKPANIFLAHVGDETFVKLLDFGIAKLVGARSLTASGMLMGTVTYMSPEQVTGSKTLDHRADLFSIAVVAYLMLTGTLPFNEEADARTLIAIMDGIFLPPSRHRPDLPRALDAWFARALAVDPANRPQSAQELADSFATAIKTPDPPRLAHGAGSTEIMPEVPEHLLAIPPAVAAPVVSPAAHPVAPPVAPAQIMPATPMATAMPLPVAQRSGTPGSAHPNNAFLVIGIAALFGVGAITLLGVVLMWFWMRKPAPHPPPDVESAAASAVTPAPPQSIAEPEPVLPSAAPVPAESVSPSASSPASSSPTQPAPAPAGKPSISSGSTQKSKKPTKPSDIF